MCRPLPRARLRTATGRALVHSGWLDRLVLRPATRRLESRPACKCVMLESSRRLPLALSRPSPCPVQLLAAQQCAHVRVALQVTGARRSVSGCQARCSGGARRSSRLGRTRTSPRPTLCSVARCASPPARTRGDGSVPARSLSLNCVFLLLAWCRGPVDIAAAQVPHWWLA